MVRPLPAVACLFALAAVARADPTAGPNWFAMRRAYNCEDGEKGFTGDIRHNIRVAHNPRRPEEPRNVTGNVTFLQPFNDSFWMTTDLAVWNNNQWEDKALTRRVSKDACTYLRNSSPNSFWLFYNGEITSQGACLIRRGVKKIESPRFFSSFPLRMFPQQPYGRYRVLGMSGVLGAKGAYECSYLEGDIFRPL